MMLDDLLVREVPNLPEPPRDAICGSNLRWSGGRVWVSSEAAQALLEGDTVLVCPRKGAGSMEIESFLDVEIRAVRSIQNGTVILHASAVATESGTILFLGPSGAGKSTAAVRVASLGLARHLSDDIVGLSCAGGVVPFTSTALLDERSLSVVNEESKIHLSATRQRRDKKWVLTMPKVVSEPPEVRKIVYLGHSHRRLVSESGRMEALLAHLVLPRFTRDLHPARHLSSLRRLALEASWFECPREDIVRLFRAISLRE